jgi:hypothetical protein
MNTDSNRDPVLARLSVLDAVDVSPARVARLRRRCQAALSQHAVSRPPAQPPSMWRRWLIPVGAGAWSAFYVVETLRRALSLYRAS